MNEKLKKYVLYLNLIFDNWVCLYLLGLVDSCLIEKNMDSVSPENGDSLEQTPIG